MKFEANKLQLVNTLDLSRKFVIDLEKLQFDSAEFYDALFADVNENIDISVIKDISLDLIPDQSVSKIADHVYSTIVSLTAQICARLNEQCFND